MDDQAIRTKKYQQMAAQIRIIAEDIRGNDRRRLLLKIARDYERMAPDFEATTLTAAPPRRARSG